jgi:hypothetical protein
MPRNEHVRRQVGDVPHRPERGAPVGGEVGRWPMQGRRLGQHGRQRFLLYGDDRVARHECAIGVPEERHMSVRMTRRVPPAPPRERWNRPVVGQRPDAGAHVDGRPWEQPCRPRQDAAADRGIGRRIAPPAREMRQFEGVRVDRDVPVLGQRLQVADVIEVGVRENDGRWRAVAEPGPRGAQDGGLVARQAGVHEHPGSVARLGLEERHIHHQCAHPGQTGCHLSTHLHASSWSRSIQGAGQSDHRRRAMRG